MTEVLLFLLGLAVVGLILLLAEQKKLRRLLDALTERVAALERKPRPAPSPAEVNPIPPSPVLERRDLPVPSATSAVPPPLPIPRPAVPPVQAPSFNWEAFMGVKLFAWLGGLALFFGVVFLVRYSFENNLISPLGRIAIGTAIGTAAIGAGWWLARGRYRVTAQSLCATGIVILYANLFAGHSFYGLISLTSAFFAMSAVTLFSFLLAVNLGAQVIVILGLLGGFLTPVLLSSATDQAPALFLYIALLDLGVAAVALRKGWLYLVTLAALGTVLTEFGWAFQFFHAAQGDRARWIFLGSEALFLTIFFLRRRRESPDLWTTIAAALAGFSALVFCFWILAIATLAKQPLYFLGCILLADAGLLALLVLGRANRSLAFGAGGLTFALLVAWIGGFAPDLPLGAMLAAVVIFALLHAATIPAAAWRPAALPFTAAGTLTPFFLLIILMERVTLANPTPILAVALVLSGILLAAAIVRRADWLALSALLGMGLTEMAWQNVRLTNEEAIPALVCYGLGLVLFVGYPFCSAQKEPAWSWAMSALAQALTFWLFYRAITAAFPNEWMGLLPAAFLLPAAISVAALFRIYRADLAQGDTRLAWQGGALLLFVSLIFPLQFHREWITLGWALEGLALLTLFHRLPHRGLRLVGVVLLGAAFARLAFNPAVLEYHKRSGTRIWNWYLYAYGLTSACLLAGARIFGQPREHPVERVGPPFLGSLGAILAFLLLNIEIADYFSIGPTLTFSFSGNFARDMTYSIAWALFALGLILAGMRLRQKAARYAGVALLGLTLAKLFFHDLNDLSELYRIGAFVGVAVILIAASFLYQRFLAPVAPKK